MTRPKTLMATMMLLGGIGFAAATAAPAVAQIACSIGYYDPLYGCVAPDDDYFAPDYAVIPPFYGRFGHPHFHGLGHGFHGGGFHGGGFHGGGHR